MRGFNVKFTEHLCVSTKSHIHSFFLIPKFYDAVHPKPQALANLKQGKHFGHAKITWSLTVSMWCSPGVSIEAALLPDIHPYGPFSPPNFIPF